MNRIDFKTSRFTDRKVSVKKAVALLAKNKIKVDNDQAEVILDFLYHIAKTYKNPQDIKHQQP